MEFVLTPFYEDIFHEERPELESLLAGIPSNATISVLANINARLYLDETSENQSRLLNEILRRQPEIVRINVFQNLVDFSKKSKKRREVSIFSSLYIKSFIHYELLHYRDGTIIDTTPEQELNIYKAYLIFASIKSQNDGEIFQRERKLNDVEFFSINTWPILLTQLEETSHQDPIPCLIRSVCFFNYLQYHSKYSRYVKIFLEKHGQKSSWEYVLSIMNVLSLNWQRQNSELIHSSFNCDNGLEQLFDSLCVNLKEYSFENKSIKDDYRLLKSKPLFKIENQYIVLDWDLIINKIYEGLVFDFFERSGIKENKEISSIPNFKKFIGGEITEKFTFQRIIKGILERKYNVINFPKNDSNGEPDTYFRNGNNIILFEIKDAYFADKAIKSGSHSVITEEINKKYNNSQKGIGQLVKQIVKLQHHPFENKSYEDLNIKTRNLKIFPVIIYTDVHFGMPGISNYLIDEFEKRVNESDLRKSFCKINNLTFLNFNYLISSFSLFKNKSFVEVICALHKEIERRYKKHKFKRQVEYLIDFNENQERLLDKLFENNKQEKLNISEIVELLDMTEGLPSN